MPPKSHFMTYGFTTRYLKKPEYGLLQAIKQRYHLTDVAEVIEVGLRLLYEVRQATNLDGQNIGDAWIMNVIDTLRTADDKDRTYPDI